MNRLLQFPLFVCAAFALCFCFMAAGIEKQAGRTPSVSKQKAKDKKMEQTKRLELRLEKAQSPALKNRLEQRLQKRNAPKDDAKWSIAAWLGFGSAVLASVCTVLEALGTHALRNGSGGGALFGVGSILGFVFLIMGLVFSIIALIKIKKKQLKGLPVAIVALVLTIVAALVWFYFLVMGVFSGGWG